MIMLRAIIAICLGFVIAYLYQPQAPLSVLSRFDIPAVIIFVAVFGTFTFMAVERRRQLKEIIATELNKIRRIYHLGKNLGASQHLRSWFTDLHGFVYEYLGVFEKNTLADYGKGNPYWRKIAYHIYTVPEIKEVKEQVLYTELLNTTAVVAEARQRVESLHSSRFAKHHWPELIAAIALFVLAVLGATTVSGVSQFLSAVTLSLGFILVSIFFDHDVWSLRSDRELAKEYVKNLGRLELRREA